MSARTPPAVDEKRGTPEAGDEALGQAIALYFEVMHGCDLALFDEVFHPAASLFDADGGEIFVDPIADYRRTIAARVPPRSVGQPRMDEILSVDPLSADAAVAKVRVRIHQNVFVDHLAFLRSPAGWKIVAKTWHRERTLPPSE